MWTRPMSKRTQINVAVDSASPDLAWDAAVTRDSAARVQNESSGQKTVSWCTCDLGLKIDSVAFMAVFVVWRSGTTSTVVAEGVAVQ